MARTRLLLSAALAAALLGASAAVRATELPLLTGPAGGTEDRLGRAIAAEVGTRLEGLVLVPKPTAGSRENVEALGGGGPAVAIVRADVLRDAYGGAGRFDQPLSGLRALAVLHDEVVHVVARAGIDELEKLVRYGRDLYSRYTLAIEVRRRLLPFIVKDLAPVLLMVFLSLMGTLLPGDKIDAKLLLTVLALLVTVELHVAHAEKSPAIGYLTLGDWLYILAYFSIGIGVTQSIAEYRLMAAGRDAAAHLLRRVGLVAALVVFVAPLAVLTSQRM